jgi:ATP/maltotriose-dependent transcriptional regulator MalT
VPPERVEPLTVEREGRRLVIRYTGQLLLLTEPNTPTSEIDDRLTRREREVLALVRVGMSNAEIAAALSLANGTVRRHLQNVYAKLGVGSRTAAIARTSRGSALPAASQEPRPSAR